MSEEVLLARAFLNRVAEPASVPLWIAVRRDGPVEVARAIREGQAGRLVSDAVAARVPEADPYLDLEAAQRHGARLVVPESDEWPHFAFSALEAAGERRARRWLAGDRKQSESGELVPPLALWIRGTLDLASVGVRSVAIVGARAETGYGAEVARRLSDGLAEREFTVVSGGAYGIDAAAHRAALAAGGDTVLVSAGGLDAPYPPGNAALFDQVAESGLCISESPPGCAPRRRRFLTRNRLIAALGTGTVVVEAAYRSGAINTANHCVELGRPVMAVPGPVTSPMSAGCHRLIARELGRAQLVTCVNDVLDVIGSPRDVFTEPDPERRETFGLQDRLDALDPAARQVFDGFPARAWTDPDRLAVATNLSPVVVVRALPMLELAGWSRVPGAATASCRRCGPHPAEHRRRSPSVPCHRPCFRLPSVTVSSRPHDGCHGYHLDRAIDWLRNPNIDSSSPSRRTAADFIDPAAGSGRTPPRPDPASGPPLRRRASLRQVGPDPGRRGSPQPSTCQRDSRGAGR